MALLCVISIPAQSQLGSSLVSGASVRADSSPERASLRRAIEKFQDRWRSTWQKEHRRQYGNLDLFEIRGIPYASKGVTETTPSRSREQLDAALSGRRPPPTPRVPPPADPITTGGFSPFQGERNAGSLTPNVQRYQALLCFIGSPTDLEIEQRKRAMYAGVSPGVTRQRAAITPVMSRLIEDPTGGTCPSWLPELEKDPPDEDESLDLAIPPRERRAVATNREALIRELDDAHMRAPNDPWIAEQRVRFLLDARATQRAQDAAASCAGDAVSCLELQALVREQAGDAQGAEAAFRRADSLSTVRAGRCLDADVLLLMAPAQRSTLSQRACSDQRAWEARLWWLADPLWGVAGNERYLTHRTRQAQMRLRSALDRDERFVWSPLAGGRGMRELIIRYGWPTHTFWSGGQLEHDISAFREVGVAIVAPPYTAKEYRRDRQALVPAPRVIDDPYVAVASDWEFSPPSGRAYEAWWPAEHMRLPVSLLPLPQGQAAVLRRDSTVRFVNAVNDATSALRVSEDEAWVAVLAGSTGPDDVRTLRESAHLGAATLRFDVHMPAAPRLLLSTEVLVPSMPQVALRDRRGVSLPSTLGDMAPGAVALSEPMLLALPSEVVETPTDPDSAAAFLAGTLTFSRTAPLALYWESYGFAASDTVDVSMRIVRDDDAGRVRRVGEVLGLVGERRDSVLITWREPDVRRGRVVEAASSVPVLSRGLQLNVQALPAGAYRLVLELLRGDGARARSERRFVLID